MFRLIPKPGHKRAYYDVFLYYCDTCDVDWDFVDRTGVEYAPTPCPKCGTCRYNFTFIETYKEIPDAEYDAVAKELNQKSDALIRAICQNPVDDD